MEDTGVRTRAQIQRMSAAGDENMAAHVKKDAAQPRARRALGNISNRQPTESNAGAKKAIVVDVKKAVGNDQAGAVTRRKSQEKGRTGRSAVREEPGELQRRTRSSSRNATAASENATQENARTAGNRKPTAGFSRTLISKSEARPSESLVTRTENLQLETTDGDQILASPMPDIDSKDLHHHLDCAEYASDIFTFFRRMEPSIRINADYMSRQTNITRQMRAVLIDWIVDVHAKFKLIPESLFLAIWILDRFLSKQEVERRNLQLAGIAALVIANKYEEVYGPVLRDYESICAGAYTRADILKMERAILKTLDFGVTIPTAFTFLARYIKASNYGQYREFRHLAQYLCEWSLLSYTCLRWSGSLVAAAAIYASFKAFQIKEGDDDWPRVLRKHTGYTVEEIKPCAAYLVNLMDKACSTQYKALFHKFKKKDYSGVARYKAPMAALGLPAAPAAN